MIVGGRKINPFNPWRELKKGSRNQDYLMWNRETFLDYFYRLEEIAINMFNWNGLPDSVDERFLELTLCEQGSAIYFKDEDLGQLCLQVMYGPKLNLYRIPIERRAYAWNGYQKELTNKDSVFIWNNYLHNATAPTLLMFAARLTELERTIDVNVKAQKTPVAIVTDDKQRLTVENVYFQFDGNKPIIIGNKNFDPNTISVINTQAPYVAGDLQILKRQIWNEALTFLGIVNSADDKKERKVSTEVFYSQGAVVAQRIVQLKSRQKAAEEINKMFGTNITVELNEEIATSIVPDNLEATESDIPKPKEGE